MLAHAVICGAVGDISFPTIRSFPYVTDHKSDLALSDFFDLASDVMVPTGHCVKAPQRDKTNVRNKQAGLFTCVASTISGTYGRNLVLWTTMKRYIPDPQSLFTASGADQTDRFLPVRSDCRGKNKNGPCQTKFERSRSTVSHLSQPLPTAWNGILIACWNKSSQWGMPGDTTVFSKIRWKTFCWNLLYQHNIGFVQSIYSKTIHSQNV